MAYKTIIGREFVGVEHKGLYAENTYIITERHTKFNVDELPVGTKVSLVHRGELVTGEVVSINLDRAIIEIESKNSTLDIEVHSAFCAELTKIN